jgi:purine-binding chemotaxis protein CheW
MRIKFALAAPAYDAATVVIVLNLGTSTVGMVVDSVSDVTNLTPDQIRPAPDMGGALSGDHLTGLGTVGDRMLILIDIVRLMCSTDLLGRTDKLAA